MIDKTHLLEWVKGIDKRLVRKINLVAVGGTAMTLLGLKPSTRDVDFCIASEDKRDFEKALDDAFRVDIFTDGYIFSEQLPDDYLEISKDILRLRNIKLRALSYVDIVVTKAARLNARDEEDIKAVAKFVSKDELIKRFNQVRKTYAGNEEDYNLNFNYILKNYFGGQ